jgi:hypothetical protein
VIRETIILSADHYILWHEMAVHLPDGGTFKIEGEWHVQQSVSVRIEPNPLSAIGSFESRFDLLAFVKSRSHQRNSVGSRSGQMHDHIGLRHDEARR